MMNLECKVLHYSPDCSVL